MLSLHGLMLFKSLSVMGRRRAKALVRRMAPVSLPAEGDLLTLPSLVEADIIPDGKSLSLVSAVECVQYGFLVCNTSYTLCIH